MIKIEAEKIRYHSLPAEEKKALNKRRSLQQKQKRQKDREMEQLGRMLRANKDMTDDMELEPLSMPIKLRQRKPKRHVFFISRRTLRLMQKWTIKKMIMSLRSQIVVCFSSAVHIILLIVVLSLKILF